METVFVFGYIVGLLTGIIFTVIAVALYYRRWERRRDANGNTYCLVRPGSRPLVDGH